MDDLEKQGTNGSVLSIRHHIYNIIRKGGKSSVKIPSSYELAKMFGTTRRVAQRELERLIFSGVLIGKPRIGTFTNPKPLEHPLFGVTVGNGDHFIWGEFELMVLSELYRELAQRPCVVHDLRVVGKTCGACINELVSLDLDGIFWIGPIDWAENHGEEFYAELARRKLPFVTCAIPHRPGLSGIDFSYRNALAELAELVELAPVRHFKEEWMAVVSRDAELRALAEPVVKLVDVMASTPLYASTMAMAARANKIE